MAIYHVLTGSGDGNSFDVVFHVAVPNAANRAGISYRTALVNSGMGGATSLPDGDGTGGTISAAEKAQVQAGAVYEHRERVETHPGETAAQLKAKVDARHAALSATGAGTFLDALAKRLSYFGYVP
jgi:hypothetical protein